MKNLRRTVLLIAAGLVVLGGATIALTAASAGDAFLPGITSKDENPNGCVDCHKQGDKGLPAVLAKIKGHPKVEKIVKTVPKDCGMCHKTGGKAPALNLAMHKAHYAEDSAFVTSYKGACLHCHALNAATGDMSLKSGPKNW